MSERILQLLMDESKWLSAAMLLAASSTGAWALHLRGKRGWDRGATLAAMNLFYGVMIGVMGMGHLLAVALAHGRGALAGSPWVLYPLGLVLAVPALALVLGAGRLAAGEERWSKRTAALDAWLATALVALGVHNLPLAAPAALNLAYQFHRRRVVGWSILTAAIAVDVALFAGSLVFLASGQSFEEFSGM